MHEDRRLILLAGGERAGKSFTSGLFGASRTPFGSLFWIVAVDYALCRAEFEYWTDNLMRMGAIASPKDISMPKFGPCRAVTKTGQLLETKTADDVKKLAMVAPDGVVIAEAAQCGYDVLLKCIGRVAEKRGWILMSGTFENSDDWYAEKFDEWQTGANYEGGISYSMPTWTNHFIFPGGREDPEILRLETLYSKVPGLFEERCAARPVPPAYLVFREFRYSQHVSEKVKYDPSLNVYLAIDPSAGTLPYSVLAVQFHPRPSDEADPDEVDAIDYCHVIDEIYEVNRTGEEMIALAKKKPWWPMVKGGAIDVEAPDERKRWAKLGKVNLHSEKVDQLAGIRRLKSFLHYTQNPKTSRVLDRPHLLIASVVKSLPYEFKKYKRKPATASDLVAKDKPPSDQPNHSIKALWYLLIARYGDVKNARIRKPVVTWRKRTNLHLR